MIIPARPDMDYEAAWHWLLGYIDTAIAIRQENDYQRPGLMAVQTMMEMLGQRIIDPRKDPE